MRSSTTSCRAKARHSPSARTSSRGKPASRRSGDDRGVSSIELAVIAPSLLLLIFLVIQAALFFYARSVALQSAREGVSQLRLFGQTPDACNSQVGATKKATVTYAKSVGSGALTGVDVVPTCQYRCKGDSRVLVVVHGKAISLIGLNLGVQEQAEGRIESFQSYSGVQDADACPNG